MGISDVTSLARLASSPRALLTQAHYLARAETISLAEAAEDRESELPLYPFLTPLRTFHPNRCHSRLLQHEQFNYSRTAETGLRFLDLVKAFNLPFFLQRAGDKHLPFRPLLLLLPGLLNSAVDALIPEFSSRSLSVTYDSE